MKQIERWLPPLVIALAAAFLAVCAIPEQNPADQMQLARLARIPVQFNDRIQPLDSMARTALMSISHRRSLQSEEDQKDGTKDDKKDGAKDETKDETKRGAPDGAKPGTRQAAKDAAKDAAKIESEYPPVHWLMDVMVSNLKPPKKDVARKQSVFRIENDEVLSFMGLEARPGLRYSMSELEPKLNALADKVDDLRKKARDESDFEPSLYEKHLLELDNKVHLYQAVAALATPLIVPPASKNEYWQSFLETFNRAHGEPAADGNPTERSLADLLRFYAAGDARQFNESLAVYEAQLQQRFPEEKRAALLEEFFNHFAPFYQCCLLYVGVFVLAALGWLGWSWPGWSRPLWRAAFWLLALTFVVHSLAIAARIYLYGRPPITSLYSSALFIGWAAVVFGIGLELVFANGLGTTLGAVIGFLTLIVAHNLGGSDTMELLEPVLDTNFWLATHVTAVTLGYASTFVAGALGIGFIILGVFTEILDKEAVKRVGSMIYGVVCFATLFSFVGTVLGGIWADQSWGRFWGWDTKENGALMIVIWNSLVLHARWGGMVRQRGVAVLAVVGNIVTAWSWFGVNQLAVGLHSYGFTESATWWIVGFVASQLLIIAFGLLPTRMWLSYIAEGDKPRVAPGQPGRGAKPQPVAQT